MHTLLNAQQREFISDMLRNYLAVGVDELNGVKLSTVVAAQYGSTHSVQQQLGNVEDIQHTLIGF